MIKEKKELNVNKRLRLRRQLAAVPGIAMAAVTLAELILVLILPSPDSQYVIYHELFRLGLILSVAAGAAYFGMIPGGFQRAQAEEDPGTGRIQRMKRRAEPEDFFFGLFLLWILVSTAYHGLDDKAVYGLPYRYQNVFLTAAYILIYFGVSKGAGDIGNPADPADAEAEMKPVRNPRSRPGRRDSRRIAIGLTVFTADLLAILALAHQFILPIAAFEAKKGLSATFYNSNHYGYFLTIAVLMSAVQFVDGQAQRTRSAGMISFLLNTAALLLNNTFGCILSSAVVLVLITGMIFRRQPDRKWRATAVLILFFAIPAAASVMTDGLVENVTTFVEDLGNIFAGSPDAASAGTNRWGLWITAFQYIRAHPILGFGCEGTAARMMSEAGVANPHSEVLTYALDYGIPGAVLYTLGVIAVFIRYIRFGLDRQPEAMMAFAAALGYFISSMFGVAMFYTTPFFFILLGYCAGGMKPDPVEKQIR